MLIRALIFVYAVAVFAQSAGIPTSADMAAYREFRVWLNAQSIDVESTQVGSPYPAEMLERYKAKLVAEGKSGAEVEAALAPLKKFGTKLEHELWNRNLTSEKPAFNTAPNGFLVRMVEGRKPGRALDVGMGQGRNAIWLAKQGWDVTGFDPADRALALANKTAAEQGVKIKTVLETSERFNFGEGQWDLIVVSYAGGREIKDQVVKGLKKGGVVVLEGFHHDATKGTSIGAGVVFQSNELTGLFPGLRVLHYEDAAAKADFGMRPTRVVRLMAEKE